MKEEVIKTGKCEYLNHENGRVCGRETNLYKYICDEHAEEVEDTPYGRYCEFCGIDTFNEKKHKEGCEAGGD
jgi:hypothetical protein